MDNQADRMEGYRYIAPRLVDVQTTRISPQPNIDEGKTKRASMACLECKKRRTKCSTGNPCSECATHERMCVYDQSADKRRKEHVLSTKNQLHATEEMLSFYHTIFEDLLETFRLGSRDQLDKLIDVIQSTERNPSIEEHGSYETIREIVDTILAESKDAEGSDENMEQGTAP